MNYTFTERYGQILVTSLMSSELELGPKKRLLSWEELESECRPCCAATSVLLPLLWLVLFFRRCYSGGLAARDVFKSCHPVLASSLPLNPVVTLTCCSLVLQWWKQGREHWHGTYTGSRDYTQRSEPHRFSAGIRPNGSCPQVMQMPAVAGNQEGDDSLDPSQESDTLGCRRPRLGTAEC